MVDDRMPRRARIHNFTEASSVTRVVTAPPYAFAATPSGLDQWDLRSGQAISLAPLSTFVERVTDIAYDARRRALWIVGDEGIARFDLDLGAVTHLPPPPAFERAAELVGAVVAPSPDGGVWLGLADGLYAADPAGTWRETGVSSAVLALHHSGETIWVGAADGLYRADSGAPIEPSGCALSAVGVLADAPGGGILAVGQIDGSQRIAHLVDGRCDLYRAAPDRVWLDAAGGGEQVLVLSSGGIYRLGPRAARSGRVRRLSRSGMTLVPMSARDGDRRFARAPFAVREVPADVPAGAQTVAISGSEVLVGTRSLGTARLGLQGDGRAEPRWLRRRELARSAIHLSVVCGDRDRCLLANGSGAVWDFDGERFARRKGATPILAVIAVGASRFALIGRDGEPAIDIAPVQGGAPVASVAVPESAQLRIVEPGPGRSLILGWSAAGAEPLAPLDGVSWIDLDRGRETRLASTARPVYDVVACGDGVFAATDDGAVEIKGDRGRLITGGPIVRLACDRRDRLVAATTEMLSRLDASGWTALVSLSEPVRDLAVGADGRIFLATADGLGVYSDGKVRRYDVRRGLLDNDVLEIAIDRVGRVWLRGRVGLGLINL